MSHYLVASDFDQTLSFNDSGLALSEMLGLPDFLEKVQGLAETNLVQQGAELAYLLRHDPAFRGVRREMLREVGRHVRLKPNIRQFIDCLDQGFNGLRFTFCVISAAPSEVVQSALEGIVAPEQIFGTEFAYDDAGEIAAVKRVPAGYGKVKVLEQEQSRLQIRPDHTVYVGDGSSDLHVMLHVNQREGFTIAVSEAQSIVRTARRTILSDNAMSVLIPILEDIAGWTSVQIRDAFEARGMVLQDWDRARTDWLTIAEAELAAVGS